MSTVKPSANEDSESNITFEQALLQLEETVMKLEAGGIPLEEATRLYESGMKLARTCNELLAGTEMKVTQIQAAYGEHVDHKPPDDPKGD